MHQWNFSDEKIWDTLTAISETVDYFQWETKSSNLNQVCFVKNLSANHCLLYDGRLHQAVCEACVYETCSCRASWQFVEQVLSFFWKWYHHVGCGFPERQRKNSLGRYLIII